MRTWWIAILCAAGILIAQDTPKSPAPAPEAKDTEKQARQKKARELLDKVEVTLGGADPEVHVIALIQLSGAWTPLDEKRAIGYLQQAFASASALPENDRHARSKMQAEVVKAAVLVNLPEASQILRGMPATPGVDARLQAADAVAGALIDKKEFDQAMESLALTPEDADYPFAAAQRLFEDLPKDDSRRLIVFGNASTAYRHRPGDAFRTFLAKHWNEVPREMAQTALGAVVNEIRGREDEPGTGESLETAKGTVKLGSRKSMDLFDLLGVIRALDPVRYKLVLEEYADLREAVQRFPDGRQSVDSSGTMRSVAQKNSFNSSYSDSDSGFEAMPPISMFAGSDQATLQDDIRTYATAQKKAGEALAAFKKDHNRGLSLADDVSVLSLRAELLIKFATEMKKDAAGARNMLSRAQNLIADIPYPGDRMAPSISVAELEHDLKNDGAAWHALEQAVTGLIAIYRDDTKADDPNVALREFWPSTLSARGLMWKAAKLFDTRAEDLLASIPGPDLLLIAQIELARAWLGASMFDAEHGSFSWQVLHTHAN